MNKLSILSSLLLVSIVSLLVFSCKKDSERFPNGGTGRTDLQVYVYDSTNTLVTGAIVNLYASAAARDANTDLVNSGATGSKGFVYFSDLASVPYYVSASKNINGMLKTGKGDTGIEIKSQDQSAVTVILE